MEIIPILFNTDMVQAILENRKCATRRRLKFLRGKNPNWTGYIRDGLMLYNGTNEPCIRPARYKVGDYLYVRETWNISCANCEMDCPAACSAPRYRYKADMEGETEDKWRPSIHMPKEAARIFLRVKNVRVERIQDMTLDDFLNEGVVLRPEAFNDPMNAYLQAKDQFIEIWNSTLKKNELNTYGWDANPWVWVIEFERYDKPEGWGEKT